MPQKKQTAKPKARIKTTQKPKRKKVEFWATVKVPKKVKVTFYARKKPAKTTIRKKSTKKTTRKKK